MGLIEELKKKRDQAVALARKVPASPVSTAIGVARKALPNTSFNNPGSVVMGVAKRYAPTAVRDVADSNTQRDQQKRAQATVTPYRIPTSYEDEQKMKGNNRPFTNLGQQVVGNTARVVNTAVQQNLRTVPQAMAGVTLKVANRTGLLNNRDYNNAVNNVLSDKKVYGGYTDKGGVLNAGTVVDSPEQAKNLTTRDVVQKSVGYGMGTYGELSPIGAKGGFAGRTLLGATEGAIGDAGSQLVNTGRIDPRQTLGSALFGGTLSNAGPVASKLLGRNTPTPRTPDPRLNDADVSGLLKIKNGRGDFMDDVEYTKALESVRKAGIDITKPEAWSQIDGVLARYNQVLEGRGDPSMFNMGQSRFKPTPLNQGGYIKNPLANDAPQVSDLVKQRRQLIEDMDASSQALTNATATQRGAMGIVPKQIMDSPEIKALQQDFYTKKSQLEQFNRLNKTNKDLQTAIKDELIAKRTQRSQKLTRQVGKTLKETRTNTTGIKNYNPDGLPTPANKVVQDLAGFYESLGSSQGVDIVDGRRVSNNSPAYRELYAELGRKPTSKDWYDYAYNQINNGTAPREITDQFEKTLNFELSTDKTIQAPEALNPQGSIPIKNKPSDMPTSDWESLIRSRVPDQTKVDVVNNGGKLEIQKKTIAPITKQETVQQTIPTEVAPEVKVKPDKDFTVSTNQYLGTLESAETTARSLADTLPAKLKGQDAIDAIVAKDNGIRTGRPEIDSVNDQVDRIYNNLYAKYKDAGFDMGYVDNYSPRIYKHPKTGEAITKADYLFLTRTPGQTISRTAQNVNPDDLLYKTPQELLAHYTRTFERAKAGREYFDALKKSGHIVESGTRPDGMMVIDAPGMPQPSPRDFDGAQIQGNYYAYPEVAKKINKVFGVDEGNKISNVTAKVAGKLQDIGLSGGVPFTPLNSFTFAQVTKELTAGKVSAPLKALFGSLSDKQAQKFFKNNAPIVEEMQKQGIRISSEYNTSTLNGFMDSLKGKKGSEKAGMLWDRTMSDPTFKRFMPRLQVETYKQVKGKLLNKYPDAEASKLAGDLVKNFYGLTDLTTQATRSQTGSDIVSTVFFAPKYRESMGRFWLNNVKALDPRKINDPAYAQNIRFNIGATLLFGAMQGANMYLNGTPTWENPEGKKDKLIIPDKYVPFNTNGKDLGVPFLSSIATVPRNIATGLAGAVTGNFGEVGKSAKSFLGYGVRPLADLANNEDYFGSQIYKEDGSTGEKLGSGASYLTKAFMPPYIREGINAASNKLPEGVKDFVGARDQSGFETLARVGETPLRFYDPNYYRGEGDKFGTGGMTKAMADSEAGKKKTAKELEMEEKKLKQSYEKSFSKEDLKFLSKDSAERQKLIDNGIKTKEELDGLDRYALNKRKELGMPAGQLGAKEVPEKIDGTDDKVKSFYTDRSYIHQDDYEAWQTSAPESDSAKDMIRRVNQMRPEGAPELPANNRTAELYADYKKEQANSKWSKLQETEKKKELLRTVYKTQLTDDQKFVDELGTEKLIYAIDNGQVDPNIMKSMVELDNALIKLGGTAMLSKTVRSRYGLGSAPSSGGSGSGKAKKPVGLGSFTLLPQKSSIGSVANLLKNARVSYKS